MSTEYSAAAIGAAAHRDMQITVPQRPALRRGTRLRHAANVVHLDGADRPQVFTGEFARTGLVRLASACDGTRTHQEIAAETGLPVDGVHTVLALLWASGAVEEGPDEDGDAGGTGTVDPHLVTVLSRLGNSTGANRSWHQSLRRLRATGLAVGGDEVLAGRLRDHLRGTCPLVGGSTGSLEVPSGAPGHALVLFLETAESSEALVERARACWESGTPLLRVRADRDTVVIGPYVDPAFTPCLDCGTAGEDAPTRAVDPADADLVAGLAAHHVTALLSRSSMTYLPLDTAVIDLDSLDSSYHPAVTRPGCPRCGFAEGPLSPRVPVAAQYEAGVAIPPRRFLDPKGHLAHYKSSNIELQSEFRSWRSCPRVALPAPDLAPLGDAGHPAAGDAPAAGRPTGTDALALLLALSFGIRGPLANGSGFKRWTAAAGNLGSATCYVVCRDPEVAPVGTYVYVENEHALALLDTGTPAGDHRVDVVVTANLRKVVRKYGTFGLRLALLDTGCALVTARRVARALALPTTLATDWSDEELGAALGVEHVDEPITAVLGLG